MRKTVRPTNYRRRGSHVVDYSHFEKGNGPAVAVCDCGARIPVAHGNLLDRAFAEHRKAAGAPPPGVTGRERDAWLEQQANV